MINDEDKTTWVNSKNHWSVITITIHWISALTILGMFGLGLWMVELEYYDAWYRKAPELHKSIGVLLFILTVIRLLWRGFNRNPLPLDSHSRNERKVATALHHLLYMLLIAIMLSGYLISTADGRSVTVFNSFQIPATIHGIEHQEDVAGVVHLWLAISLISLTVIHASAAIKHHFIDHDRTLKRMFGR